MSIELKEFKDKMGKSLDSLASEYTTIRAGRANPVSYTHLTLPTT